MPLEPVPATDANIEEAARHLREGRLVAFPTETVYGLGADARNGEAVAQIFASKGRPTFNPLIVNVQDLAEARCIAFLSPLAERLAEAFWPGSLTLVLDQRPDSGLSDLVSAGLPSVAIRVPSHPVARRLQQLAGCPIAAPSANRSGHVSATTAAHVAEDMPPEAAPALAIILDDGPCRFGIESTIVDARPEIPRLLRPGAVTAEAIVEVIATPLCEPPATNETASGAAPRTSPGQLESHYAPSKPVILNVTAPAAGQALLAFGPPPDGFKGPLFNLSPARNLIEAAANLFTALRTLDRANASSIAVMPIPDTGLGHAINDRLSRAAAPRPVGP